MAICARQHKQRVSLANWHGVKVQRNVTLSTEAKQQFASHGLAVTFRGPTLPGSSHRVQAAR